MTDSPKPTTRRTKPASAPTEHKLLVLTAGANFITRESQLLNIESKLDALTADGWTVHITSIEIGCSCITVMGHASR
jgi:hypothetical protein